MNEKNDIWTINLKINEFKFFLNNWKKTKWVFNKAPVIMHLFYFSVIPFFWINRKKCLKINKPIRFVTNEPSFIGLLSMKKRCTYPALWSHITISKAKQLSYIIAIDWIDTVNSTLGLFNVCYLSLSSSKFICKTI